MESGTTTLPATTQGSSTWASVTLAQTYDVVPLVFVLVDQGSGYNGDSPAALRIRNVTTTSFDVVQVEPQSIADTDVGAHPAVEVHYVVVEPGDHTLRDGTRVLASSIDTAAYQGKNASGTKSWDNVTYTTAFSATPVVLTTIQSINNETATLPGEASAPWMTAAMKNSNANGFDVAIERAETSVGNVTNSENIAYLSIDAGKTGILNLSDCTQVMYETLLTSDSVRGWENSCKKYSFSNSYNVFPEVIGNMNSRDGGDGGWLRRCDLSTTQVGLAVDEDQAADTERSHTTEIAGLTVFEKAFVFDSAFNLGACIVQPVLDYHMDECYWFDNSGGITDDVKDSASFALDGTSYASAQTIDVISAPPLCKNGTFNGATDYIDTTDNPALTTTNNYSISTWMKANTFTNTYEILAMKSTNYSDGFTLYTYWDGNDPNVGYIVLQTGDGSTNDFVYSTIDANVWLQVVVTYDGTMIRLYINGSEAATKAFTTTISNASVPFVAGVGLGGNYYYDGDLDELKLFDKTLRAIDIETLYENEVNLLNFDGTPRTCNTCSASITANTWEMVSIPAELRSGSYTVADVLSDDITGIYNTDWIVFERTYSDINNSSWYTALTETSVLKFGEGYFFASKNNGTWDVNNIPAVDYNATDPNCPANRCVEVNLKPVALNGAIEDLNGTGTYRNYLTSFPGKSPVDWADCRFLLDNVYFTPSAADDNGSGFASKQIWQYNPGDTNASSNGYTTCSDITPGGCKLLPYKAFWVQLRGATKGSSVKLLIPQE